ncbi:MAG TPA: hypothetical protein ENI51_04145, partial [Candidatus Atribacteria bacterium]|nr:hypothetical protein [Candidatus Atribacteria bacterium]
MWIFLTVLGILFFFGFIGWVLELNKKAKEYDQVKPRLDKLDNEEEKLKIDKIKWKTELEKRKRAIEQLAKEKSKGFPWLAKAYADYFYLVDKGIADYMVRKAHPAWKSA